MRTNRLHRSLIISLVVLVVPIAVIGQRNRAVPASSKTQDRVDERSRSFRVENLQASNISFDSLTAPPAAPRRQMVPTHRYLRVPKGPLVPNSFASTPLKVNTLEARGLVKNVIVLPSGARPNQVLEPTVANKGDLIFYTANHFAGISTDGGLTFKFVNPAQAFTGTPYTFCCDQVVQYVPQIDMFIWSLQALSFRAQVLLYATAEDVKRNLWKRLVFTPGSLGVPGADLDYTDMSLGTNMLYWSTNVFDDPQDGNISVVVRIPLQGLSNNNPQALAIKRRWGVRLVQNTGSTGYFAAHVNSSTLRIYSWEENAPEMTFNNVSVPSWNDVSGWGPVGSRVVGATRTADELWLAWNADPRSDRPAKYIQIARVNRTTFALVGSGDVWSPDHRVGIPALATNAVTNEVGISYVFSRNHSHAVGILTGTPVHITTAEGPFDVAGSRWGDYLSIRSLYDGAAPTAQPTKFFAATGYAFDGSSRIQPRFIVFGREVP